MIGRPSAWRPTDAGPPPVEPLPADGTPPAAGISSHAGAPPPGEARDQPWRPIPGPVDRESFEDAQRRHRRASWRWTLACAVAVAIMGLPLSAVISPLVMAVATLVTALANLVVETPDLMAPFRDALEEEAVDSVLLIVSLAVALIVPGAVALSACWFRVRRLLADAGTGLELAALGARQPVPGDLEERQLVNVVEEIALAAGLRPPSVHLIDSPVANAAMVGSSPDDAAIVVSRGLLDTLGRDETQGIIAHLVGRIGNGDLGIARTISTLYFTLRLVSAAFDAASNQNARRASGVVLRLILRPGTARRHPEQVPAAALALLELQSATIGDDTSSSTGSGYGILLLPVGVAQLAFMVNESVLSWLMVTPLLKRAWRSRSELADASAVQLTRNPDGVAKGLAQLSQQGSLVPGTEPMAHLFVVGREAHERRDRRRQQAQQAEVQARITERRGMDKIRAIVVAGLDQQRAAEAEGRTTADRNESPLVGFHPPLAQRLDRLAAMGATVAFDDHNPRISPLAWVVLILVGGPLFALILVLMMAVCVLSTGVALMIYFVFLVGPVLALDALIRGQIS